jgi:hypothetical protein
VACGWVRSRLGCWLHRPSINQGAEDELRQPTACTHSALSPVDRLYQTVWQKATNGQPQASPFPLDPASDRLSECRDEENAMLPRDPLG